MLRALRRHVRDLAGRRAAELALDEERRRYWRIFEGAGVAIWECDCTAVKTALDALRAGGVHDIRGYLTERADLRRELMRRVRVRDVNHKALSMHGAAGKDELLRLLPTMLRGEAELAFVAECEALAEGRRELTVETTAYDAQGHRQDILLTAVFPPGDTGLSGVLISVLDTTEWKEREREAQQARQALAHLARVGTMGELAASLSHELKQPLTAIRSNAQAARRFLAADPPDLTELGAILADIEADDGRAEDILDRIRGFVIRGEWNPVPVDLNEVVRSVVRLARADHHVQGVGVTLELDDEPIIVRGDRVQLQQVVLNLILNGAEATANWSGRPLTIRTECCGDEVALLSVRDAGPGFDPAALERVFEPFYSTKADGMGMGLAITRSIVRAHGGRVWAENLEEGGAMLRVTLPLDGAAG